MQKSRGQPHSTGRLGFSWGNSSPVCRPISACSRDRQLENSAMSVDSVLWRPGDLVCKPKWLASRRWNQRERLILTHGLQKRTTTQTSKPWKSRGYTLTCPLLDIVPILVLGSRVILVWKIENWTEIQTSSLRNHEEDNKDTPSRQPRPPPEDSRPISSTYPASQKKTAISRTEAQKVAAAAAE